MSEDIDYEHAHGVVCCELAELQAKVRGLETELAAAKAEAYGAKEGAKWAFAEVDKLREALRAELTAEREAHALTTAQIAQLMRFKWNDDQMRCMEKERDSLKSAYFAMQKQNDALRAELAAEREVSADFAEQLKLRSESQMAADLQEALNAHNETIAERDAARAELAAARKFAAAQGNENEELQEELDKTRAELAAANDRSSANYTRWMRSEEEAEARETVLRAELAAERERKEHYQTLFKDMVPQAVAFREALRKAREHIDSLASRLDAHDREMAFDVDLCAEIDALLTDEAKESDDGLV